MIRSRPRHKVKPGPAPLSDDRFDKFLAAMHWHVGRRKDDPEFARSPHYYYAAVSQWFGRLSLGEKAAVTYAALLPSVPPPPPELVRKAWGQTDDDRRPRRMGCRACT
jgi:hypothetical protein